MNEYPTKNKKRAQRRYRDHRAHEKKLKKFKYQKRTENAKLPELPEVVEVVVGEELGTGDLHLRRDQDETDRLMRETLGPASNESSGDGLPIQETTDRSS